MRLRSFALTALGVLAMAGCHSPASSPPVTSPTPSVVTPIPTAPTPTVSTEPTTHTPVRDALNDLLKSEAGQAVFPKGTRLRTVRVSRGVAVLDFSSEFNSLSTMGDSAESQVQHSLRETLASFPGVKKMRVTVEGKRFESEATDWNTPFPVRGEAAPSEGGARGVSSSEERP